MKNKAFLWILLLVVLGLAGWFFYQRYAEKNANPVSGLKPRVGISIAEIHSITDSKMDVNLKVLIDNPLPVGLSIQDFAYTVRVDGVKIAESDYAKPIELKAQDSSVVTVPTQIKLDAFSSIAKKGEARGQDSATYQIAALLHLAKPFLGKDTLRLEAEKRLPLFHLPEIQLVGYDVEKFRLKNTDLDLQIRFINKNDFDISFKDMTYSVDLGKEGNTIRGQSPGLTKVPARSNKVYTIPVQLTVGKMLKASVQMLFKGKDFPYALHLDCKMASSNDMLKNSQMKTVIRGNLEDIEGLKKTVEVKSKKD